MKKYSIPYGKQYIDEEDIQCVIDVLRSDFLTQGPKINEFEIEFAEYVGSNYAVAVSNGTAALHLSNIALGLKRGQKVLTTPITFAATANSVLYCDAEVEFVDIDPDTYLIDIDKLEQKLVSVPIGSYAGIIPVDFTGLPVNTEKLRELADKYNLWIIEDACHAPGGFFINSKGNKVKSGSGTYSDLTCFSFHPVKHIAAGEGGMITTNDEELYKRLLKLRTHGISKIDMTKNHGGWYYEMQELGYNYRLPDINAALGLSQLRKADTGLKSRMEIAYKYDSSFEDIKVIKTQTQSKNTQNAYHLYVIEVENRKGLYDFLHKNNIYSQIHYIPVHLMPYYMDIGWAKGDFPSAEAYYNKCISLPMYPTLTDEEQQYVIDKVLEFIV